ncbi:hypothetical protein Tcan_04336 [Toxocara canis]|uniref:Uncharacterized protein n=1 Tax=Toxocara canis TaxID=6265 RepID=A0A0B2VP03_TOXCA|nr:hypothetical protein Tcan_04336 [Toxocara canis]
MKRLANSKAVQAKLVYSLADEACRKFSKLVKCGELLILKQYKRSESKILQMKRDVFKAVRAKQAGYFQSYVNDASRKFSELYKRSELKLLRRYKQCKQKSCVRTSKEVYIAMSEKDS